MIDFLNKENEKNIAILILDKLINEIENNKKNNWRDKINAIGYVKHLLDNYNI